LRTVFAVMPVGATGLGIVLGFPSFKYKKYFQEVWHFNLYKNQILLEMCSVIFHTWSTYCNIAFQNVFNKKFMHIIIINVLLSVTWQAC